MLLKIIHCIDGHCINEIIHGLCITFIDGHVSTISIYINIHMYNLQKCTQINYVFFVPMASRCGHVATKDSTQRAGEREKAGRARDGKRSAKSQVVHTGISWIDPAIPSIGGFLSR